ncbi:hypothetical protein EVJ58_g2397 [Rhodofomes roseus]|uniref:BTB domain-containing protein n=1 Tax=Rhodofomes roseus TaxID=34475 RepID=A0A4Y9YRI6_9APHY|nr:hypothetical protein EVJ58_g2397 [Rhodofomes roseus]
MEFEDGTAIWASSGTVQAPLVESFIMDDQVSEEFHADDADIKVRSSDGVLFKVHQRTVDKYSEGLLGNGVPNSRGEFELKENCETLGLLFQYMYRKRPELSGVPFSTLRSVADAADTYQMYSLSDMCECQMSRHARTYPVDVLAYAAKRSLADLVDEAASRSTGIDAETALTALGRETFIPWVLYRETWNTIIRDVNDPPAVLHKGGMRTCELWHMYYMAVADDLRAFGPGEVQEGGRVFGKYRSSLRSCTHCKLRADNWARAFGSAPGRMPKFSSVVSEMTS